MQRLVLIGGGVLLIAALVIGLRGSGQNWSWYLSYAHEDNNPYGMSVLYHLLPAFNAGERSMVTQAPADLDLRAFAGTYFSIGHHSGLSPADLDSLAAWAALGNTVFLAHEALPDYLPGLDSSRLPHAEQVTPASVDTLPYAEAMTPASVDTLPYAEAMTPASMDTLPYAEAMTPASMDTFFTAEITLTQPDWHMELELPALRLNFSQAPFKTAEDHKLVYRVWNKDEPFPWSLIQPDSLRILFPEVRTLGLAEGMAKGQDKFRGANLVELPVGRGRMLIFTTPMALANFYLVQPDGRDYAERVLSHLTPGDLLWDAGTRNTTTPYQPAESPLRFVLNHPALRMAWYLLLLIGLLYLVFRSRRRQAAIPLLNPKSNQSLEYLNTVAKLYYQQRSDHRAIGEMMREHFMGFLRERFHLRQPGLTEETALRLISLTGIDAASVRSLFRRLSELDSRYEFQDYSLLRLHRELQQFYEKCT